MNTVFANIHEYTQVTNRVAKVTASFTQGHLDQRTAYDAVAATLGTGLTPIQSSFRWLDSNKTSAIGYVYAPGQVEFISGELPAKYRQVASNIYMDETDESMWDMKQGAGGSYLSRQGTEDLCAMLETARVSPRGSQPRMSQVLQASVAVRELAAFVDEGRRNATVDHGVVLGIGEKDTLMVLSYAKQEPVVVKSSMVFASYQLDSKEVPRLPKDKMAAVVAARRAATPGSMADKVNAAGVYDPHLTPQEYWTLQYSYAPEYLEKVLKQVNEMAAL